MEYDRELDRLERETEEVPAPKAKKRRTVPKPKHTPEQLLLWQGIDPDAVKRSGIDTDPTVSAMADDILRGDADWLLTPDI